ncbi:MAG: serine/threonine protein kinase, partial [Ruminococcus sp.]|nr:serine/threonine protein kinase [Ruminococcus sp.]
IENESNIMYRLRSCRNIVTYEEEDIKPLYINGKFEGYYFLIRMEYLKNVRQMICRGQFDFSENNIVRLAVDIAEGLKSAHNIGVIHRDIKPSNFFVSDDGVYKLGDFGISRLIILANSFAGTEGYIAPEIYMSKSCADKGYTKQADIYSLGICLYQLMNNGFFPLENEEISTETAVDMRIQGRTFGRPANASEGFSEIIMKACAYDTKKRYSTIGEMLMDLELLRKGDFRTSSENFERSLETYARETIFSPPPTAENFSQTEEYTDELKQVRNPKNIANFFIFSAIFLTIAVVAVFTATVITKKIKNDNSEVSYVVSETEEENFTQTESTGQNTNKSVMPSTDWQIIPPEEFVQPDIIP